MSRPKKESALSAHEERILRMTIDDTQIFEVPVRTVKRLLALIDALRAGHAVPATQEVTPVPDLTFVTHPTRTDIFYMRIVEHRGDDTTILSAIVSSPEAASIMRADFADRVFNVPAGDRHQGVVSRPGSEIADMLERGTLP